MEEKEFKNLTWLITLIIFCIGFIALQLGSVSYGTTFFVLFPLSVGFSIGTLRKEKRQLVYLIFGLVLFFGFLLAGALEGLVCVLMAMPIFFLMVFFGHLAQEKRRERNEHERNKYLVTIVPLLVLFCLDPIEQMIRPEPTVTTIENSIVLNYSADMVFDQVKAMDKLDAKKPIGIRMGLPSPYKCVLEADTIGAKRHCLFDNGEIVAEITKYEKGKILEMDVVDYTLTGRDWFEFVDATYTFEEIGEQTKITRTSSYKSVLNPRIYWAPLEAWGIDQEHQFVLNSLKKNLDEL